jgi:LmbE family N-acetylglucosaminyl deacetylase
MNPDLVLTHRPNDYHPDHRYTSQLVADATYLVTVPSIASDVPALKRDPIVGYLSDRFTRPVPFRPDVVVPIDAVVEDVVDALAYHASQFYEWLPFNMGILESVPADPSARRAMLSTWYRESYCLKACDLGLSDRACGTLVEAFEISEYGLPMSDERRRAIFPFAAL